MYNIILILINILFARRCQLPGDPDNASYYLPNEIMNMSYPYDSRTESFSKCTVYDTNFTDKYYKSNTPTQRIRNCDKWIYDKSEFQNTVVTDVRIKKFTRLLSWS